VTPYAVTTGDVTAAHLDLLEAVRRVVANLPDGLTCHDVCRACVAALPGRLTHHTGWFARPGVDHSWLAPAGLPPGTARTVLDPYPASGVVSGPLLVCVEGLLNPWRRLYMDRPPPHPPVHPEGGDA
jgi:hypothetical protein